MEPTLSAILNVPMPFLLVMVGILGACVGSFITLITYRLPRDEKIGATRSRCPQCLTALGVRDLVPMLSWAVSGGRCRHCGARVGMRYPLTELACALGAAGLLWHFGPTLVAVSLIGLWWSLVALTVTDLEHYIILDEVQIAVGLFGALYVHAMGYPWFDAAIAATVGGGLGLVIKYGFLWIRRKDGLGMGDVKFLFVAGIWLADPASFVPFLFFSGVGGVLLGTLWRVVTKSDRFPFGPALALALFLCVLLPEMALRFWNLYGLLR